MKRRYLKYLLWALPAVTLAGGALFVLFSPAFKVSSIRIAGANRLSEREVLDLVPFARDDHILFIPLKKARERIASDERVAWCEIVRRLPNEVDIVIGEEHPVLLLSAERVWGLSESGKLLPIEHPYEIPNLPFLSGIGTETVLEPRKHLKSIKLDIGLSFWRELRDISPQFLDKVSEIHVEDDGCIRIVLTGDGLVVDFGNRDCKRRLHRLTAVLEKLGMDRGEARIIDLRYSNQAVVQMAKTNG